MTEFLDIYELAMMMNVRVTTVKRRIKYRPFDLPPKMHLGGSKMMRWRKHEVETWLYEHGHSNHHLS